MEDLIRVATEHVRDNESKYVAMGEVGRVEEPEA